MPPDRRRALGAAGERLAEAHLVASGYRIVDRNFRTQWGELDLVATDGRSLVFCEVKTRAGPGSAGPAAPLEAIGWAKRRRLRLMAREWLAKARPDVKRGLGSDLRFDAIAVGLAPDGALTALEHVEDAF